MVSVITAAPHSTQKMPVTSGLKRRAIQATTSISRKVDGACVWVRKKSKSSTATATAIAPTSVAASGTVGLVKRGRPVSWVSVSHPPISSPSTPRVAIADIDRVPRPSAIDQVSCGMNSSPRVVRMTE